MKSICYVVPYFGTLPKKGFQLWLMSCKANPTVNWILFTDDHTAYDYPENVKVYYTTFDAIRERFQAHFDFPIVLDRGWKLCDFKESYGEIFAEELKGYDFWGNCDVDLIWGDIRKYYTDALLEQYEKIGFLAHSILYKNTPEVNARYRTIIDGELNYITAFSEAEGHCFDESGMDAIYQHLGIPYYQGIDFANLTKYETKFHLDMLPDEEYKNDRQIFVWDKGKIWRYYLLDGKMHQEEFLYIHFWCRPMSYKVTDFSGNAPILIYSDVATDKPFEVSEKLVARLGRGNPVAFYLKTLWINRKKLTPERILFNIKGSLARKKH